MAKVTFLFQINGISVKNFTQGTNAVSLVDLWFLLRMMIFNDLDETRLFCHFRRKPKDNLRKWHQKA